MSAERIIIDTDPGVDDAVAILLALASPELEVLGVTVVAGNVPLEAGVENACRIVALSGRCEVPVMAGAPGPLVRDQVYGKYAAIGAFDETLVGDIRVAPSTEHGIAFLVRQARAAAEAGTPITICAIGPLTNIALALVQHPDVAQGIKQIVCMGGAFTALGHRVPWAEYNIYADPHAAHTVFECGVPLVLMPLDVTLQALFAAPEIAAFRAQGGAPGRALANLLTTYDRSDVEKYGRPGGPIHDAMTVAWLLEPELFTGRTARVGVQVSGAVPGHTYADFRGAADPSATVMNGVDERGYLDLVTRRIATYGAVAEVARTEGT